MTELFYKVTSFIGIDKAIFYRSSGVMISSVGGVMTLVLISLFFTPDEQGIYYTFSSIAALQVFFELGLTTIIIQYVAHEVAHLQVNGNYTLSGPQYHQSRLASLLHLFVKWYVVTALSIFIFLLGSGFWFFHRFADIMISWQYPWITLCIGTSLYFYMNMILAFIEGFGYVKEIAKIRMVSQLVGLCVSSICLVSGNGLYALGGVTICSSLCSFLLFFREKWQHLLLNLWNVPIYNKLSYFGEIFPYQWKIALSWLSGYFILQLLNPVLFAFEGAKVAGQMGMTAKVLGICSSFGICWINTKIPQFSILIAQKNYSALDLIFNRTLKQMLSVTFCSLFSFIILLELISYLKIGYKGVLFSERFLPFLPLLFMAISIFINLFASAFAIYLRSHKQEPYMWLSIITGIVCGTSTIFITKYYGMTAMIFSNCFLIIVSNIYAYQIFKRKKMEWHHDIIK